MPLISGRQECSEAEGAEQGKPAIADGHPSFASHLVFHLKPCVRHTPSLRVPFSDEFCLRVDLQLVVDAGPVALDGPDAEPKVFGDVLVGTSAQQRLQDFSLSLGQIVKS